MKVFHNPHHAEYRPSKSFFNGRFMPYPEVPERMTAILDALRGDARFALSEPPDLPVAALARVHARGYLELLETLCRRLKEGEEFFPGVIARAPLLLRSAYPRVRAGYHTVDSFTPLLPQSFTAALGAAATAWAGAEALRAGERAAYCLARPPGHHAGKDFWAGYCLINHAALAAVSLLDLGKVAILDVDYHHGNGTQDIFYERADVLYVSLHCRPEEAYPYIAGAAEETGSGPGLGMNRNIPLPGGTAWREYQPALETALDTVRRFGPAFVVVSLGFDALEGDPMGTFRLHPEDFRAMGAMLRALDSPILAVQEGGYLLPALGQAARRFFDGMVFDGLN
jgi:acetoin utilization deacetylase AcuC-like enzyme